MTILTQFIFRLSFGLALSMSLTPARYVTSGFYRVHLLVLMGLHVFAGLANWTGAWQVFYLALAAAAVSYVGSVLWLYEKPALGTAALSAVGILSLWGAIQASDVSSGAGGWLLFLKIADLTSSGFLMGVTVAAMLLGHWYLNTPTMDLVPLRRLVQLVLAAVSVRVVFSGLGLVCRLAEGAEWTTDTSLLAFLGLRWLSGLVGLAILAWMTWETLKVPNTQSATGILYVGVVAAFLGELTSQLLSAGTVYPV